MNRGKTALKRGVAVASVAAMAIAGAVLAAPAASAAPDISASLTQIRATPIADAAMIKNNALITQASDYNSGNHYGSAVAVGTGAVPVIGVGTGLATSGFQVFIPGDNAASAFAAGSTFQVTLSSNATFASTPSVSITQQPVLLSALDSDAGWAGPTVLGMTSASVPAPVAGVAALGTNPITASASGGTLTVTLNKADQNSSVDLTSPAAGYLVSFTGVKVTAVDGVTPGPVTAIVNSKAATIAYESPFTVSIAKDAGYPSNVKGAVSLPDVTVTETSKTGFAAGAVSLLATGTDAGTGTPSTFTLGGTLKVTSSTGTTPTVTNPVAGNTAVATLGAADFSNSTLDSLTFSGLTIDGFKAGTAANLALVISGAAGTSGDSALGWAHTPNATTGASVSIPAVTAPPRLAGDNRFDTAADIATAFRAEKGAPSTAVVLANGTNAKDGVDALSANFLAGAVGGAILLTDSSNTLPQETQAGLVTLFKGSAGTGTPAAVTIYVMGKTDSVSDAAVARAQFVVAAAVNSGVKVNVVRLDGANRYATSAKAVTTAGVGAIGSYDLGSGSLKTAFLASGEVNADALAAGSLSSGAGIPVLLAQAGSVDKTVTDAIDSLGIKQLIVLGGTDRISDAVVAGLKTDHGIANAVRVAGSGVNGRFDTAAALNTLAYQTVAKGGLGLSFATGATAYLANGLAGFPDALAVGPLAGLDNNPLLTVPATSLPASTLLFLTTNGSSLSDVTALGQSDRISDAEITAAQKAIGG